MFSNVENMDFGWKKRLERASTIVAMVDLHQVLRERAKRLKIGKSCWEGQGSGRGGADIKMPFGLLCFKNNNQP